ncbi:hypothetical protein Cgig2_032879 [Carnegiea gigantea]|uniref:Uncharacterized protein n=1 Tax=Carnegiea gigantea TaxID=171969 RepID=A0A9Q1GVJ3_9CARY|nr:hypothetical protein Cgig2_032879 [Carnegiea gigantea]
MAIGQRTETFLAAFLSCWLCTFILSVGDAGCICPDTFSIISLMTSDSKNRCYHPSDAHPAIPIQSNAPLPQDELPVKVCEPSTKKVNRAFARREISVFNADDVIKEVDKNAARVFGKAILDKVCHTPFDGLPSLKGDFDSLYATILQRSVDVTPLKSKVEGLIKQACKLDEASHRLNTEGEAKMAELKHIESRHQELLKEL